MKKKESIVIDIIIFIVFGTIGLLTIVWSQQSRGAEFGFFGSKEVRHIKGVGGYFLEYRKSDSRFGGHIGSFRDLDNKRDPVVIAIDYRIIKWRRWRTDIGLAYINKITYANGTKGNFVLSNCFLLSKRIRMEACHRHYSHGRFLGISKNSTNRGLNFAGIRITFK